MPARRDKHTHSWNGMGRKPSHRQCKKNQPTRSGYNKKPTKRGSTITLTHSGKCSEMMPCQCRYELHASTGSLQVPARKKLRSRESENCSPESPTITAISAANHKIHTGSVRASNFYRAFSTSKNLVCSYGVCFTSCTLQLALNCGSHIMQNHDFIFVVTFIHLSRRKVRAFSLSLTSCLSV